MRDSKRIIAILALLVYDWEGENVSSVQKQKQKRVRMVFLDWCDHSLKEIIFIVWLQVHYNAGNEYPNRSIPRFFEINV